MKEKILISLISLIILVAAGVLFRHGEKVINEDAVWGYSILHFAAEENTAKQNTDGSDPLIVVITNFEGTTTTYDVSFFINDKELGQAQQKIVAGNTQNIHPPDKLAETISSLTKNATAEYLVEIKWNDKKRTLTKKLTSKNEK